MNQLVHTCLEVIRTQLANRTTTFLSASLPCHALIVLAQLLNVPEEFSDLAPGLIVEFSRLSHQLIDDLHCKDHHLRGDGLQ